MARWHSCNVLQTTPVGRRLWRFESRKSGPVVDKEQTLASGQPLPQGQVGKGWTALWQPKLNVAWLPPEQVFLRVIHLPQADAAETRAMIEFQLEKLSPIPVTQLVWSFHLLPGGPVPPPAAPAAPDAGAETTATAAPVVPPQTVIVVMVARGVVEELLGKLEANGFRADRLEVPLLDLLQPPTGIDDGAWIYPDPASGRALVAWWQGRTLQQIGLLHLPADRKQTDGLREQLSQMTWAGELEGWLKAPPRWHLVADATIAAEWQTLFSQALDQPVRPEPPPPAAELALATVRRTTRPDSTGNLLPPEYQVRYQQQFHDRLWMRGLIAAGVVYGVFVAIYFVGLTWMQFQTGKVESRHAELGRSYTNVMQLKARYTILKQRQDLKYAALDCWRVTAELLPAGATLDALDFRDGSKLAISGTAPAGDANAIIDFNTAMSKAVVGDQKLFSKVESPVIQQNLQDRAHPMVTWNFSCELNHPEDTP